MREPPAGPPAAPPPVTSVWLTCQQPARDPRRGRYVPATSSHPGKMLPHLAAHAIATYTAPGDLVLDPMCGSGTTLVEAIRAGRDAIGAPPKMSQSRSLYSPGCGRGPHRAIGRAGRSRN